MTTTWTGPSSPAGTEFRHAVGLKKLDSGVWVPITRAGARQARFTAVDGVHVILDGATSGKKLAKVNGVSALVLAEED